MPEPLWALGGVCRNFWGRRGGVCGWVCRNFLGRRGGVCRNFWGVGMLRGGYAGTFGGSRGGMPELLWAQGGLCRNFCGLGGVCRNCCGLRGGMPELLGA